MYPENTIIAHYAGSLSYGTNHEGSDEDIRGVYVAPKHVVNTPFYPRESYEVINVEEHEDAQLWELSKFIREIAGASPSYVETLFIPEEQVIQKAPAFEFLRANSEIFITQKLAKGYMGFAESQFAKAVRSQQFVSNPGAVSNAKRESLIKKFGYDTKYALHSMRTLRMAGEILQSHEVVIKRPDALELVTDFVEGNLSFKDYFDKFQDELNLVRLAVESPSSLPLDVDRKSAALLMVEAQEIALS
ncbi:DNA polymerase beta superfamily protein [Vibrio owensii]|uniref:DNA polymerase beta superfamily protein n=1 Tax=Vibrio owensii TaxID=696485 RepID=UPI003CC5C52D